MYGISNFRISRISPRALTLLEEGINLRILNIFRQSVNLTDSNKNVLSLVSEEIGPGPFSAVLEPTGNVNNSGFDFRHLVPENADINNAQKYLRLGDLRIAIARGQEWHPRPQWHELKQFSIEPFRQLIREKLTAFGSDESLVSPILRGNNLVFHHEQVANAWLFMKNGIVNENSEEFQEGVIQVIGLGPGLTPAGDDFIVGLLYAFWATEQTEDWISAAGEAVESVMNRTSTLSRAWLKAALCGEAAGQWHDLIEAILNKNSQNVIARTQVILNTGSSSGADALTGFSAGLSTMVDSI